MSEEKEYLPALPIKVASSCLHAFAETVGNLGKPVPQPDFASLSTKLMRPVTTSLQIPISVSRAGIKALVEKASIVNTEERVLADISPLSEEEDVQSRNSAFNSPHLLTDAKVLWQIGRAGRKSPHLHWSKTFTYRVGKDIDPISHPTIPEYLVPSSAEGRENGTSELTISFSINSEWKGLSLVFSYQRWGGGKDFVSLDGNLISPVSGLGTGRMRNIHLILPPLNSGDHSITLKPDSSVASNGYRVDQFIIRALPQVKPAHQHTK